MNIEQRVSRLEHHCKLLNLDDEQGGTDACDPKPSYTVTRRGPQQAWGNKFKPGIIQQVRRGDGVVFATGDMVRGPEILMNLYSPDAEYLAIESFCETPGICYAVMKGMCLPIDDIRPKAFASVPRKEWEVLSFRATPSNENITGMVWSKNEYDNYGPYGGHSFNGMMGYDDGVGVKSGDWEIFEVMRLSDGTVWKLGDEIVPKSEAVTIITKFSTNTNGGMFVYGQNGYLGLLDEAKKPAPVRDWEIVEFGDLSCIFTHKDGKWYTCPASPYQHNEVTLLAREPIHKVRHIPSGTTWTIGDRTEKCGTITSFKIEPDNTMRVCGNEGWQILSLVRKAEALFTTADGVDINDPMTIVYIYWRTGDIRMINVQDHNGNDFYSTREAAQAAYNKWLYDQPVLSINDLIPVFGSITVNQRRAEEVQNLVKAKLAGK